MLDLSFMKIENSVDDIDTNEKKMNEIQQLASIARYVGSYTWKYKNDDKVHDGIIAQELLQVPGLKDAVYKDETGTLRVDTKYLSFATLGYLAALIRLIIEQPPITSTPEDKMEQEIIEEEKIPGEMDTGEEAVEKTINGEEIIDESTDTDAAE